MEQRRWGDKPYYSLDHYFKSIYGEKIYKAALHAGCTCPVRDGTLDDKGCIFCSAGGSGEFAAALPLTADGRVPGMGHPAGIRIRIEKFVG